MTKKDFSKVRLSRPSLRMKADNSAVMKQIPSTPHLPVDALATPRPLSPPKLLSTPTPTLADALVTLRLLLPLRPLSTPNPTLADALVTLRPLSPPKLLSTPTPTLADALATLKTPLTPLTPYLQVDALTASKQTQSET